MKNPSKSSCFLLPYLFALVTIFIPVLRGFSQKVEPVLPPPIDFNQLQGFPADSKQTFGDRKMLPSTAKVQSSARVATTWEWEKMKKESEGGFAEDIVRIGNKLFMCSGMELFVSTDNGTSWNLVLKSGYLMMKGYIPNYYFSSDRKLLVSGDSILFGESLSTDGGNTWQKMAIKQSNLPTYYFAPTAMNFKGRDLFLGTYYNGILWSTDFGQTFTELNGGLPALCNLYESAHVIEFHKGKPLVTTVSGVYSWQGSDWLKHAGHNLPMTVINQGQAYLIDGIDFLGDTWIASTNFGLYRSTDEGENWQKIGGLPDLVATSTWTLFSQPAIYYKVDVKDQKLIASFENGIWISSNGGNSWIHSVIPENVEVKKVYSEGSLLLAITSGGVFKSSDNGLNWIRSNTGFDRVFYGAIKSDGKNTYLSSPHRGLLTTLDQGRTWTSIQPGFENGFTTIRDFVDGEAVATSTKYYPYGGSTQSYRSGIYLKEQSSNTWDKASWPVDVPYSVSISKSGKYAVKGSVNLQYQSGFYVSKDKGANWKSVFKGVTHNNLVEDEVSSVLYHGDTLYCGTAYSGIYRSLDDGDTWTSITSVANGWKLPTDVNDFYIDDFVVQVEHIVHHETRLYAIVSHVNGAQLLYYSADDGQSWSRAGLPGNPGEIPTIQSMTVAAGGKVFVAVSFYDTSYSNVHSALMVSNDFGVTWSQHGSDFPGQYPYSVAQVGNYIYVAGSADLWRIPFREIKTTTLYSPSFLENLNTEVNVPVQANSFKEIVLAKFSLKWDPAVAKYVGVSPGLAGTGPSTFDTSRTTDGELTFSWNDSQPRTLSDSSAIFHVHLKLTGKPGDTTSLKIAALSSGIEITDKDKNDITAVSRPGTIGIVQIITSINDESPVVCYPVPFDQKLSIQFASPSDQDVSILLTDATGRAVDDLRIKAVRGINTIGWDRGAEVPPGLYIVKLQTAAGSFRMKVVKR